MLNRSIKVRHNFCEPNRTKLSKTFELNRTLCKRKLKKLDDNSELCQVFGFQYRKFDEIFILGGETLYGYKFVIYLLTWWRILPFYITVFEKFNIYRSSAILPRKYLHLGEQISMPNQQSGVT